MLTLSPGTRFMIGIAITLAIGISSGAVVLTNAIPGDWIKPVEAWCGIIAFVGSAAQTGLQGLGMTNANKLAVAQDLSSDQKAVLAASDPKIAQVVTTREIAQAAGPDGVGAKIVSKAA